MKLLCVSGAGDETGVSCRQSSVHPWPKPVMKDLVLAAFVSPQVQIVHLPQVQRVWKKMWLKYLVSNLLL